MKYELMQAGIQVSFAVHVGADLSRHAVTYTGLVNTEELGMFIADPDRMDRAVLNHLFYLFNAAHPADFKSYSLSVGDVVRLDNVRVWRCAPIEWERLS